MTFLLKGLRLRSMFKTMSKKKKKRKHDSSTSTRKVERNSTLRAQWKISCRARGNFYYHHTVCTDTVCRRKGFLKNVVMVYAATNPMHAFLFFSF